MSIFDEILIPFHHVIKRCGEIHVLNPPQCMELFTKYSVQESLMELCTWDFFDSNLISVRTLSLIWGICHIFGVESSKHQSKKTDYQTHTKNMDLSNFKLCLILLIFGIFFFPCLILLIVLFWHSRRADPNINTMFWIAVVLLILWTIGIAGGILGGILRAIF